MGKFIVGSRAFFSACDGFRGTGHDYLVLEDNPEGYKWRHEQSLRHVSTFRYRREPVVDMVRRTIECGDALLVGKFLVPEVAEAIGATVADILPLEALLPGLAPLYQYLTVIFEAVKRNNSFVLTEEQREEAYKAYRQSRK